MESNGFKESLQRKTEQIEALLKRYLPEETGYQKTVLEAMNYSMLAGGKRLRPMLMLETYRLFGGKSKVIEPFMAAIEMIHTYSLVHDDLPAMDNDVLRRGRPTTWKVYGEAAGILAGDALLTFAFETVAKAFAMTDRADLVGRAIGVLANKAGVYGMCGGQEVDVALTGQPIPEDVLNFIYRLKTGALLEASMMIGAILAGADEEQIALTEQIAADLGMAFQIRDDMLDVISTEEELGKPIGSDERNIKTTYVTLYGLEQAGAQVAALSERAIAGLNRLPGEKDFFISFIQKLEKRSK